MHHLLHVTQHASDRMERRRAAAHAYRVARLARAAGRSAAAQPSCASDVPAAGLLPVRAWA
jgi:hypothetical protein